MMSINKQKLYCFDTSAFVTLSRTNEKVIEVPPSLWDHLEGMMQDGTLISHSLVFDEIISKSKNPDFIAKWIEGKKQYFLERTPVQISTVSEIVHQFPDLIDPAREHEQADPWLIALAIEKSQELKLFDFNISIVVSQENPNSSKKIPAVCKYFGIQHEFLREFFDNIGLGTSLTKK